MLAFSAVFTVRCATPTGNDDAGVDPNNNPTDGGNSPPNVTVTTIDLGPDAGAKHIAALPNGNLIVTEGNRLRVLEVDQTGAHVKVNSTDFAGFNWPNSVVVDDQGRVIVGGYQEVYMYPNGIDGQRVVYIAKVGNQPLDNLTWGGTPKRLWLITKSNPTAPTMRLYRYDNASGTDAGTPTIVLERDDFGHQSMAVDDDNNVYFYDGNGCRLLMLTTDGGFSVTAGNELDQLNVCNIGGLILNEPKISQGSGIGIDPTGKKLLYSEGMHKVLLDVTPRADGKSYPSIYTQFDQATEPGRFVSTPNAIYLLDGETKIRKLTLE